MYVLLVLLLAIFAVLYYLMRDNGGVIHYIRVLLNTLLKQYMNGDLNTILTIGMFGYFGISLFSFHYGLFL